MLMKLIISSLALSVSSANAAEQGVTIADKAIECWTMPSGASASKQTVKLMVQLDEFGEVADITAKEYPQGSDGKALVQSLSRALQRCGPYETTKSSTVEVVFSTEKFGNRIDPFKGK